MALPPACPSYAASHSQIHDMDRCWRCKHREGFNGLRQVEIPCRSLGLCTKCIDELRA
jgi:hypothetical protein